jgi:hypothetical protein
MQDSTSAQCPEWTLTGQLHHDELALAAVNGILLHHRVCRRRRTGKKVEDKKIFIIND